MGGQNDAQPESCAEEWPHVGDEVEQSGEEADQKSVGDAEDGQTTRDDGGDDGHLGGQTNEVAGQQLGGIVQDPLHPFHVPVWCEGLQDAGEQLAILQEKEGHEGNAEEGDDEVACHGEQTTENAPETVRAQGGAEGIAQRSCIQPGQRVFPCGNQQRQNVVGQPPQVPGDALEIEAGEHIGLGADQGCKQAHQQSKRQRHQHEGKDGPDGGADGPTGNPGPVTPLDQGPADEAQGNGENEVGCEV